MSLPNQITLARIALIPLMMLAMPFNQWAGMIIFLAAACTDGIDGYIARKYYLITNLGKFLDPLADKLLISAALIYMVQIDRLSAWIVVLIISREFAVTGLRLVAAGSGEVIAAGTLGKWKTVSQIIAVALLMIADTPLRYTLSQVMIWAALILTLWSGIDYFYRNRHFLLKGE